jgi:NAD(P)-dependent dehydrogenase (short-subunit alcohol dehydrogenase family)
MGFNQWLWGVYEYLCFLISGIIVAMHDGNPILRLKRTYYHKLPSPPLMREQAISQIDASKVRGKVAIVTGGNAGIGVETCYFLLRAGYHVIIGCRSVKLGEEAVAYLKSEAEKVNLRKVNVEVIPLDLASQQSISEFVTTVKARNLAVSLLVNNAGVMFIENWPTKEGFEVHFGVNHLGHFKLTMELLDVLIKNGPSRVITLTSDTYTFGGFDLSKARGERFHRWWAYCDSKLMNLLSVQGLHRKISEAGLSERVKFYAVHPGCVHTGITRGTHPIINWLYGLSIVRLFLNLVEARDGASGTVYAALSKDVESLSGRFFSMTYCEEVASNAVHKEQQEDELIAFSELHTHTSLDQVIKSVKNI